MFPIAEKVAVAEVTVNPGAMRFVLLTGSGLTFDTDSIFPKGNPCKSILNF